MLSPKQKEFFTAFKSRKFNFMLYGGGIGGGKSILALGILDQLSQMYPNTRYGVIRKSLSTIRRNTIPSFNKILELNGDPNRGKLSKQDWAFKYKNGSEILFVEANISTDPNLNKLKGLEVTGLCYEEINEVSEQAFSIGITRYGRWNNDKYNIPPFILATCNPDTNWVKHKWYDPYTNNTLSSPFYFLQALPHDNPHNTKEFLASLEYLPEAEYQRYVKGNWDFASDPNQLIQYIWYKNCYSKEEDTMRTPIYIGVDVAREGNDYTIFCYGDDKGILFFEKYKHNKTNETANLLALKIDALGICPDNVIIDAIGLGAGVIDSLEEKKKYVTSFKSSEKPSTDLPHFSFANKRIESAWMFREDIKNEEITLPEEPELLKQTMQIRYFSKDKYLALESKDQAKKRLGYSPDYFDAAVMFNYVRRGYATGNISFDYMNSLTQSQANRTLYASIMHPGTKTLEFNRIRELARVY